jgi:thiamine kinase-like enzyme
MHASDLEFVRPLVGGGGTASVDLVRAEGREWVLKRHRPRDLAAERLFHRTQARVAVERQRRLATDLPSTFLERAENQLARLPEFEPSPFVVTHGDLHLNNALVRSDGIVLFDKPVDVWVAPAVFDLSLIFSEAFPGARYGAAREGDEERLAGLWAGRGWL